MSEIKDTTKVYAMLVYDCACDRFIEDLATKCSQETYMISFETLKVFEEYFKRALKEIDLTDDTVDGELPPWYNKLP